MEDSALRTVRRLTCTWEATMLGRVNGTGDDSKEQPDEPVEAEDDEPAVGPLGTEVFEKGGRSKDAETRDLRPDDK